MKKLCLNGPFLWALGPFGISFSFFFFFLDKMLIDFISSKIAVKTAKGLQGTSYTWCKLYKEIDKAIQKE